MSRTSNVFARVEPDVKEQAEVILTRLGIPMSNAIGMFLRQVVIQRGIPFEVKLNENAPLMLRNMTKEELNAELEKGMAEVRAGNTIPEHEFLEELRRDYGL